MSQLYNVVDDDKIDSGRLKLIHFKGQAARSGLIATVFKSSKHIRIMCTMAIASGFGSWNSIPWLRFMHVGIRMRCFPLISFSHADDREQPWPRHHTSMSYSLNQGRARRLSQILVSYDLFVKSLDCTSSNTRNYTPEMAQLNRGCSSSTV
jgi:hypothetical protein